MISVVGCTSILEGYGQLLSSLCLYMRFIKLGQLYNGWTYITERHTLLPLGDGVRSACLARRWLRADSFRSCSGTSVDYMKIIFQRYFSINKYFLFVNTRLFARKSGKLKIALHSLVKLSNISNTVKSWILHPPPSLLNMGQPLNKGQITTTQVLFLTKITN